MIIDILIFLKCISLPEQLVLTLSNFSSQQYLYKFFQGASNSFCPLPSCPPQSSQLFSLILPHTYSLLLQFSFSLRRQDTPMLLLLFAFSLSVSLFSSSPPGPIIPLCSLLSSPFHRHTPHCQHSSSPGCLYECCLLSWHLGSQIHIWKQSLGQILQCKTDPIFSEFHWQTLTDLYGFFKHAKGNFRK